VTLTSAGAAATATLTSPGQIGRAAPSNAAGTRLGNYAISYANGTLTVNAAPLTVTADSTSKYYGQTVTFAGTEFKITAGSLYNTDTLTSVTLTSAGAAATATLTSPGPTYSIVPSNAAGTRLGNYAISYANGTLTVNAAPLTVTANSTSKYYGQTVTFAGAEFKITAGSLYNTDTLTSVTLTSAEIG